MSLFNNQMVGTIISSVLDYDNLIKITDDPDVIDPKITFWVPADGRSIIGSKLSLLTKLNSAPDLRGRFMRGLNLIYSVGQPSLMITTADEEDANSNRLAGSYQGDAFKSHSHPASGHINGSVCGSNMTHDVSEGDQKWNCDPNYGDHNVVVNVQPFGGIETRPKNIGVYFYLKIN